MITHPDQVVTCCDFWLLKELDFVRKARKNYCKYIDIFKEI